MFVSIIRLVLGMNLSSFYKQIKQQYVARYTVIKSADDKFNIYKYNYSRFHMHLLKISYALLQEIVIFK